MLSDAGLTTQQIFDVFHEEIEAQGGRVTDTFHEDQRLFARSVLPSDEELRPGDRLQGGVALKSTRTQVWVYPYVFRQVCKNGAIMAETLGSRSLEQIQEQEPEDVLEAVRDTVLVCCDPDVFNQNVRRMRTAAERHADMTLQLMSMISRFREVANSGLMEEIIRQFFRENDRSQFGLANAVTAVARETPDPDTKWNLEELGGGIAIALPPQTPPSDMRAKAGNVGWAVASR